MSEIQNEEDTPEIHIGTIVSVSGMMSGLQTVTFTERLPIYVENYGVRQLYRACEHLGQKTPVGMQIEFSMDDMMGTIMETFNVIGNETHIACYGCQKVIPRENKSEYIPCKVCERVYCLDCEKEPCRYCKVMNPTPSTPP